MAETKVVLCLTWVLELTWHEARLFEGPLLPSDISPSHQVQQKRLVECSVHLRMSPAGTQEVGLSAAAPSLWNNIPPKVMLMIIPGEPENLFCLLTPGIREWCQAHKMVIPFLSIYILRITSSKTFNS